jgi:ferritin-like protein
MSSFERRGLPFRDVFDSSFDSIIFVDYLNFESAQSLLAQRVIGKPVPFFALSYSLSGGLARDLIRNFRAVMECRQTPSPLSDLRAICRAVVAADLKAKLRATEISAKRIDLDAETDPFLERLYQLQAAVPDETALLAAVPSLFAWAGGVAASRPPSTDRKDAERRERLSALAEELATYIYYTVTILQLFNNQMTAATLPSPASAGGLDSLAKARQLLAVNPKITLAILGKFRSVHGLADILVQPSAAAPSAAPPNGGPPGAAPFAAFSETLRRPPSPIRRHEPEAADRQKRRSRPPRSSRPAL